MCERAIYRCVMSIVNKLGLGHLTDGDPTYPIRFGINTRHLNRRNRFIAASRLNGRFATTRDILRLSIAHPLSYPGAFHQQRLCQEPQSYLDNAQVEPRMDRYYAFTSDRHIHSHLTTIIINEAAIARVSFSSLLHRSIVDWERKICGLKRRDAVYLEWSPTSL